MFIQELRLWIIIWHEFLMFVQLLFLNEKQSTRDRYIFK